MDPTLQILITAVVSVFGSVMASSGFWAYMQKRAEKKDKGSPQNRMLRGLGHVKIMEKGMMYIDRKYITKDEYEDLFTYLYEPYIALGGNGSAKRIMDEVKKLPIRPAGYKKGEQ